MAARKRNDEPWDIEPGQHLRRKEVHAKYKGSAQSGIAPISNSVNILIFTGSKGSKYGYTYDEWQADGAYHYTGEGQLGPQKMERGNKALAEPGRRIRLFDEVSKGVVRYVGEFRLAEVDEPVYEAQAPDMAGHQRTVFVFKLWPVDENLDLPARSEITEPRVRVVPVESHKSNEYTVRRSGGVTVADKAEAQLVERYRASLVARGHPVNRRAIDIPGEEDPFYADVFDEKTGELIEAKRDSGRDNVRHALGQVLDYARYVEHDKLAVLVPKWPGTDLVNLLTAHGINCIYEARLGEFHRVDARSGTASPAT
ncbi:hypothetical protein [Saccharopolyspora mangrovi]|uniref:ScoMcrA-like SRA domain-containing protein n=1 Tax=Saccharopolyspora mangrovi TaxID=3082379 RepID=A0ABU6A408_9PSEU|nr:hypothetical protein [Saccharopolyspora sp. S2-29]MEB3366213.1 hypothetical protein [Saccharopolyspora sp. S2-29]